jgi:hypothetical protein
MVRSTLALAAVLSVAATSLAGDLVTPPVLVGVSTNVRCSLLNVSSAPIPAQIQLLIVPGPTVLVDSGTVTVPAGEVLGIAFDGPGNGVYCRFVKASKSKVRAVISTFVGSGDLSDQVVAVAQ